MIWDDMETYDTLTHVHNSKGFDHAVLLTRIHLKVLNVLTTYKS